MIYKQFLKHKKRDENFIFKSLHVYLPFKITLLVLLLGLLYYGVSEGTQKLASYLEPLQSIIPPRKEEKRIRRKLDRIKALKQMLHGGGKKILSALPVFFLAFLGTFYKKN